MIYYIHNTQLDKTRNIPGFIAYLIVIMWFLLTVMASGAVHAQEQTAPPIVLTASDIMPEIEQALTEYGMAPGAEITLNNPDQKIAVTDNAAVAHVSFNETSGRFVVRLHQNQMAIAGFARAVKSFPVLTRAHNRGDIIQENDVIYIETANARPGVFLQDAAALIGMEARRPLRPQSPLRASDVAAPLLIKKGALITLTYAMDGLRLSHQGVAMASGGAGDVISVRNIQSDRVLKAVIQDQNLARVATPRAPQTSFEG